VPCGGRGRSGEGGAMVWYHLGRHGMGAVALGRSDNSGRAANRGSGGRGG
jgi:hypothetical protein